MADDKVTSNSLYTTPIAKLFLPTDLGDESNPLCPLTVAETVGGELVMMMRFERPLVMVGAASGGALASRMAPEAAVGKSGGSVRESLEYWGDGGDSLCYGGGEKWEGGRWGGLFIGLGVRAHADHHPESILQPNRRFIKSLLRIGLNSWFGFCLTQTLSDPGDKALRAQSLG
jgi:hypothetical protein